MSWARQHFRLTQVKSRYLAALVVLLLILGFFVLFVIYPAFESGLSKRRMRRIENLMGLELSPYISGYEYSFYTDIGFLGPDYICLLKVYLGKDQFEGLVDHNGFPAPEEDKAIQGHLEVGEEAGWAPRWWKPSEIADWASCEKYEPGGCWYASHGRDLEGRDVAYIQFIEM